MSIQSFEEHTPSIDPSAWVHASAVVIGQVSLARDVSIWPTAVVRGDVHRVRVGAGTNVQDGAVLHVTHAGPWTGDGHALEVGEEVTVGHRAILHACRVGDRSVIGMAATVMDGAVIEPETLLGAGALVPPGKVLTGGHLWVGSPARMLRPLSDRERAWLEYSARHYVRLKDRYRACPGTGAAPGREA
jgi:carbonic anhydrase/acetyltransferase-like protein (isoleucine patch superfamily)